MNLNRIDHDGFTSRHRVIGRAAAFAVFVLGMVTEITETMTAETEIETKTATETEPDKTLNINVEVGTSTKGLEVTNRELYRTNGEVCLRGTVDTKYVW